MKLKNYEASARLLKVIDEYYRERRLQWPTTEEAMGWALTEFGEAWELLLQKKGGWVRNHPEDKPGWDPRLFAEELGDAMMMLMVAGFCEGFNPVEELLAKIERKLKEKGD